MTTNDRTRYKIYTQGGAVHDLVGDQIRIEDDQVTVTYGGTLVGFVRCVSAVLAYELDERLPKPDDTEARYEREDAEARQADPDTERDDLPGEPVEPGDLRAGDRVAFTYRGKRYEGALAGTARRREPITSLEHAGLLVTSEGRWAGGISDVRLIERAPREDEDEREDAEARQRRLLDEALAALIEPLLPCTPDQASSFISLKIARAAREHIYSEPDQTWVTRDIDEAERRAKKAEVERDTAHKIRGMAEADRDGWKAKYAALREDVERGARYWTSYESSGKHTQNVARAAGYDLTAYLDHDDERTPQADPDTVTLRRDDLTEPSILRLAAADLRDNHHLGINGLPRSLPATLYKLADAMEADQ